MLEGQNLRTWRRELQYLIATADAQRAEELKRELTAFHFRMEDIFETARGEWDFYFEIQIEDGVRSYYVGAAHGEITGEMEVLDPNFFSLLNRLEHSLREFNDFKDRCAGPRCPVIEAYFVHNDPMLPGMVMRLTRSAAGNYEQQIVAHSNGRG